MLWPTAWLAACLASPACKAWLDDLIERLRRVRPIAYEKSKDNGPGPTQDKRPDKKACDTAEKLLTQYERLANKLNKKIPPKTLARLNALRDAGTITFSDLPGWADREFPGEFKDDTLEQVRKKCK
jgi:hypothetical protein